MCNVVTDRFPLNSAGVDFNNNIENIKRYYISQSPTLPDIFRLRFTYYLKENCQPTLHRLAIPTSRHKQNN